MSRHQENVAGPKQALKWGLDMGTFEEKLIGGPSHGTFILEMTDAKTGERLAYLEKSNIITLDAGILAARLFRDSRNPSAGVNPNKGITMLCVGTGATGNLLSPDAPTANQRRLNSPINPNLGGRKAFSSAQFRDSNGLAVSYETNIVDFTATFGESEAVGALNEMGLISAYNSSATVSNWLDNGPSSWGTRDPTMPLTAKDILANYTTFGVISKPSTALLSITWRLTF